MSAYVELHPDGDGQHVWSGFLACLAGLAHELGAIAAPDVAAISPEERKFRGERAPWIERRGPVTFAWGERLGEDPRGGVGYVREVDVTIEGGVDTITFDRFDLYELVSFSWTERADVVRKIGVRVCGPDTERLVGAVVRWAKLAKLHPASIKPSP